MAKTEPTEKKSKAARIKSALASIKKNHGEGSIAVGRNTIAKVESWPSKIATLDIALGCGGIPRGRIIEIFGAESSGKTTTCLELIAACQSHQFKEGKGSAAFIDAEHAIDPEWASRIGVDLNTLIFAQPDSGEEALDIVLQLAEAGVDLVVVDSVANLVPKDELDGEITDSNIGAQARMMSKAMRMLTSKAKTSGTTIIFVNQIREKIGVKYGNNETTTGGRALKFYSSIRIEVKGVGQVKKGENVLGKKTRSRIVKNKVAPPFKNADYNIMFDPSKQQYGVDKVVNLVEAAVSVKVISQAGSTFKYEQGDNVIFKASSWDKLYEAIEAHPDVVPAIREETYKRFIGEIPIEPNTMTDEDLLDEMDEDAAVDAEEESASEEESGEEDE